MSSKITLVITMLLLYTAGAWADDFNPSNPPDPSAKYKVTVSVSPAEAGYASGGGQFEKGKQIRLRTSANSGYQFLYWACEGEQVSTSMNYYYTVTDQPVNLVAVYQYNPTNPSDPQSYNTHYLYLTTNQEGSCTFNLTSGAKQKVGQYISVKAQNVSQGFEFQGWYVGDEKVSSNLSFSYLMPDNDVTLTARFVYNPTSPGDPESAADEPVTPKIRAISYSRQYGEDNPTFEYTKNTDIAGTPVLTCNATKTSSVGTYPIVVSQGSVTTEGVVLSNGTLTITKAPLTIAAKSYTIKQGEALPAFEAEYTGFKNGETSTVLVAQPQLACTATSESAAGTYEITLSNAVAPNYAITYKKGTLTIKNRVGDANGDGKVTITDAVTVVNYILGNPSNGFVFDAADVNGDKKITITDAVGVVNIILGAGSSESARVFSIDKEEVADPE